MRRLRQHATVLSFFALALLFLLAPQLDLWAAGLFFDHTQGFHFEWHGVPRVVFNIVEYGVWVYAGVLILLIVIASISRQSRVARIRKELIYLLVVLILGPGLLVNGVLKEHVERARPSDVYEFGGTREFTPALIPTRECATNCAFVSGHASAAFYLLAFGFAFRRRRRFWLVAGIAAGAFVGVMRMLAGAHFLSDIVFAFFAVYVTAWLVYKVMYGSLRTAPVVERADGQAPA